MTGPGPLDADGVADLRRGTAALVRLDQRLGGVAAAPAVLRAHRLARRRVAEGGVRPGLRREAASALAESAEVAGWSLYDSGDDATTARVNREALALARVAGDRAMELFVLQNAALHAESLGLPRRSIELSRRAMAGGRLSPRLETMFHLRLARAHALLGAGSAARDHLARARGLFLDGARDDDPHWCWWLDEGQLAWFRGAVALDAGRGDEAAEHLDLAARDTPEPRMNLIYRAWALHAHTRNGAWAEAERSLRDLIATAPGPRSYRARERVAASIGLLLRGRAPAAVRDAAMELRAGTPGGEPPETGPPAHAQRGERAPGGG